MILESFWILVLLNNHYMNLLFYFENEIIPLLGGTERATENLAIALSREGHNIFYLSRNNTGAKTSFPNFYLPSDSVDYKTYIENLLSKISIDIIFNQAGNTDACTFINHKYLTTRAKIITCLHFCPYQGYDKIFSDIHFFSVKDVIRLFKSPYTKKKVMRLFKHYYNMALQYTDAFVVLSDSFKCDIKEIVGTNKIENKLFAIPNINSFEKSSTSINKENSVLYIGRLQYQTKRVDRLLDAWRYIDNDGYKLDILGDGPERWYYEKYARKLRLRNVSFHGFVDPCPFYKNAKVVTLTSTHESFGMTLIEGMSYGCVPVVYNTYSAVKDIVANGINGFLVEPYNSQLFSNKIKMLLDNKVIYDNMERNCREYVDRYSPLVVVNQWNKLIKTML